jgi:negative regulator of replication initiation
VPYDTRLKLITLLAVTRELASDQLDLSEENKLFASHMDPDAIEDVREFVTKAQTNLSFIMSRGGKGGGWLREPHLDEMSKTVRGLVHRLVLDSNAETTTAYYSAKALSHLLPGLFESHQWQDEDTERFLSDTESSVSVIFNFTKINVLGATAVLVALEGSGNTNQRIRNFCNRIVSDVSGASIATSDSLKKTLELLILLNASLLVYDTDNLPVAQPRIIFAVKQIMSWMQSTTLDNDFASEACRALQRLLPVMKDIYGSYWQTSLNYCTDVWVKSEEAGGLSNDLMPVVGMTLRLYSVFKSLLGSNDANDDLLDAFAESKDRICSGLVALLKLRRFKDNLPLQSIDELLKRAVADVPSSDFKDSAEIYPLIASEFQAVQSAAFDILHRMIPEAQQQISVDVLLENTSKLKCILFKIVI